ncbi:hypothetical protein LCGC14_0884040 [marine sediment metagenome]|uniref:Uncharacterized protein n=1 Tax=marine sediment metagenome TaxID=412755 RepID=A0A0F9RKL4_9ZZZZ
MGAEQTLRARMDALATQLRAEAGLGVCQEGPNPWALALDHCARQIALILEETPDV